MPASGPLALVGGDELNPGNEPQDRVLRRDRVVLDAHVRSLGPTDRELADPWKVDGDHPLLPEHEQAQAPRHG